MGRKLLRRGVLPLLVLLALGLLTGPAAAKLGPALTRAVESLERDPVYVDPGAGDVLDATAAEQLRRRIAGSRAGPIYVAVLGPEAKAEAGGTTTATLAQLGQTVDPGGTFIVVIGSELRAGSGRAGLSGGTISSLADQAVTAERGKGAAAVIGDLIGRIEAAASGAQPAGSGDEPFTPDAQEPEPSTRPSLVGPLVLLGVAGAGIFAVARSSRRRRERERRQLEDVRAAVMQDLVALGEALGAIDLDVRMPGADAAAIADYERALDQYQRASASLDRAARPGDVREVAAAIEEGRFALEGAKARLAGREPPERRPPCFFDPRHGPSVRDVEWAPSEGSSRTVPVCAADAQRIEDGIDPEPRRVPVGGAEVPYWDAPRYYSPWFGGHFGGGGLIPGLLIGTMLGNAMSPGYAHAGEWSPAGDEPFGRPDFGGGDVGGGDVGGGDFGGDFGGGDFGGGDLGGGDFGGGDF